MDDVQPPPEHVRAKLVQSKLLHRRRSHQEPILCVLIRLKQWIFRKAGMLSAGCVLVGVLIYCSP